MESTEIINKNWLKVVGASKDESDFRVEISLMQINTEILIVTIPNASVVG